MSKGFTWPRRTVWSQQMDLPQWHVPCVPGCLRPQELGILGQPPGPVGSGTQWLLTLLHTMSPGSFLEGAWGQVPPLSTMAAGSRSRGAGSDSRIPGCLLLSPPWGSGFGASGPCTQPYAVAVAWLLSPCLFPCR